MRECIASFKERIMEVLGSETSARMEFLEKYSNK